MGKNGTTSGDVNGDGLSDFVIVDTNYATTKAVYVVFGKTSTNSLTQANISGGNGGFAINTNGLFGDADIVGDFNGDGLDDVLFAGNNNTSTDPGKAWLIYGKTDGTVVNLSAITSGSGNQYGFVIQQGVLDSGNSTSYYNMSMMGQSVSAAGDVNGDGFADLLVSLPNADVGTAIDAGQTYVIYGGQFASGATSPIFTAANGDRIGTSGADTLVGTSGNNQMVAGAGDDTLTGNGGADVLYGGAGNDTFVLNASNVAAFANASNTTQAVMKVDGGTGIDTLKLDGSGITLDLTAITKADLGNVEIFDISGSGANTLKLNMRDVLELGQRNSFNVDASAVDSKVQLMITGDNGDFVQLTDIANWSQPVTNSTYSFGGHTYNVYNNAGAQLLIDQLIVQAGHLTA